MYAQKDTSAKDRKAARAVLKKAYNKKYRQNHALLKFVGTMVSLLLIAACGASIFSDMLEYNEKQAELEELKLRAEQLEAENAEYESILNEEDERTYMERLAIEKLGYAYPDERRFYDTTRS